MYRVLFYFINQLFLNGKQQQQKIFRICVEGQKKREREQEGQCPVDRIDKRFIDLYLSNK